MKNEIPRLTQLQAFVDWEMQNHPHQQSNAKHIVQWAVDEIERLMRENKKMREQLAIASSVEH